LLVTEACTDSLQSLCALNYSFKPLDAHSLFSCLAKGLAYLYQFKIVHGFDIALLFLTSRRVAFHEVLFRVQAYQPKNNTLQQSWRVFFVQARRHGRASVSHHASKFRQLLCTHCLHWCRRIVGYDKAAIKGFTAPEVLGIRIRFHMFQTDILEYCNFLTDVLRFFCFSI
jgi:hypothetical protein